MEKVYFKDETNKVVMTLSGFSYQQDIIQSVYFDIDVEFEFFKAKTRIEAEKFDFDDLLTGLNNIYKSKWDSAYFNPIEKQININFKLMGSSLIEVHVELHCQMFTGMLKFEYVTNQICLFELIKGIDDVITEIT